MRCVDWGPCGDDIVRFYDRGRIVGPAVRAPKAIRNGVFDVVVISPGCVPQDLLSEAERAGSKAIWIGHNGAGNLADSTDEPVEQDSRSSCRWPRRRSG